jgi:hypothetical protein
MAWIKQMSGGGDREILMLAANLMNPNASRSKLTDKFLCKSYTKNVITIRAV